MLGDGFTLTADGSRHNYRRVDPCHLQRADFLAMVTESSVARTGDCMAGIADACLVGRPCDFSAAKIADMTAMSPTPTPTLASTRAIESILPVVGLDITVLAIAKGAPWR